MNEAIKLAIEEGGYNPFPYIQQKVIKVEQDPVLARSSITYKDGHWEWAHQNDVVLDPKFWQTLGKVLGREVKADMEINFVGSEKQLIVTRKDVSIMEYLAHQYFDLVLTGGDVDAFWQRLLNK